MKMENKNQRTRRYLVVSWQEYHVSRKCIISYNRPTVFLTGPLLVLIMLTNNYESKNIITKTNCTLVTNNTPYMYISTSLNKILGHFC